VQNECFLLDSAFSSTSLLSLDLPGGPKSKTPFTASAATPSRYNLGYFRGYVTH
jgi:hypothetical protein